MSAPTSTTARVAPPASDVVFQPSPRQQLLVLARAMLRSFFRDRMALFFTFFFPLMFLVVFGLIFGNAGANPTSIAVVGDGPVIRALPHGVFTVQRFSTFDEAVAKVKSGDLPAAITEQGGTVVLRFAASDQVRAGTIQGLVNATVAQANIAATGQAPRFTADFRPVEASSLKAIQYITPGILSWGVATSAVFGAALTLVTWRKKQLLRRVRLAPAPVWTVVGARVGVSLITALVQGVVYVGLALTPPFGLKLTGQWYLGIPLLLIGTLSFLSIGLLVGAIAKTEEAGQAMANFIVLPMAFLSGTFFDISGAPPWLQAVSQVLPLRHLNDGMLDVLVRGKGIGALVLPSVVLLAFAVVVTFVATRIFRWDDA